MISIVTAESQSREVLVVFCADPKQANDALDRLHDAKTYSAIRSICIVQDSLAESIIHRKFHNRKLKFLKFDQMNEV